MARPPKTIQAHELNGTFRPDRQGHREIEPQSGGAPVKPEWLTGDASEFWDEVEPMLRKMGVAQSADTQQLAIMCRWWAEWRRIDKRLSELADDGDGYKLIIQAGLAWKNFDKIASRFGFTPVDRTKLGKPKEEPKSKLLDMMKKRENLN